MIRARLSPAAATAIVAGLAFILLMLAYRTGVTRSIDRATFAFFNTIENPAFDAIGQANDELARVLPTFGIAVLMAIALAWRRHWLWVVPLFIAATALVEFVVKLGFGRGLHLGDVLAAARELIGFRYHTGTAFPSGHVARAVFLAAVAVPLFPWWLASPLVVFAALTFFARLYTEAHRLSDVLGGVALGVWAACAGLWASQILDAIWRWRARGSPVQRTD